MLLKLEPADYHLHFVIRTIASPRTLSYYTKLIHAVQRSKAFSVRSWILEVIMHYIRHHISWVRRLCRRARSYMDIAFQMARACIVFVPRSL